MARPQKYKRRNYLINPEFQLRFMAYISIAVLAGLSVLYLSNLWYFDLLLDQGYELGLDPGHPYYAFIEDQRTLLHRTYACVSVIVFVLLMTFALFLSHRIAGPVYRLKVQMRDIVAKNGDVRPVHLRSKDFFPEVAEEMNEMLAYLKENEGFGTIRPDDSLKTVEGEEGSETRAVAARSSVSG
ncbi:MAG: methyl-accepting chemotaxis protein [Candidatus Azotimanducaceae bacterium]|jgi:methyl-accepting chemotaxis protein